MRSINASWFRHLVLKMRQDCIIPRWVEQWHSRSTHAASTTKTMPKTQSAWSNSNMATKQYEKPDHHGLGQHSNETFLDVFEMRIGQTRSQSVAESLATMFLSQPPHPWQMAWSHESPSPNSQSCSHRLLAMCHSQYQAFRSHNLTVIFPVNWLIYLIINMFLSLQWLIGNVS